jgi:CRP/FNR family transcriptional regulator, anaerobic regulatory protein
VAIGAGTNACKRELLCGTLVLALGLSVRIALPYEPARGERSAGAGRVGGGLAHGLQVYRRNAVLYRKGEPRTCLYGIEAGVVALLRQTPGRHREIVEFAFAGDVLGYGLFEHHTSWAQAVGEVRVERLPLSALDQILNSDKRAFDRYAEALQREFEDRRNQLVNTERSLVQRVAALLVALSRQNALEGRDPRVVGDALACGAVTAWLGIDVHALASALVELERSGLIEQSPPDGVRLLDRARLERLVDELSLPPASTHG